MNALNFLNYIIEVTYTGRQSCCPKQRITYYGFDIELIYTVAYDSSYCIVLKFKVEHNVGQSRLKTH